MAVKRFLLLVNHMNGMLRHKDFGIVVLCTLFYRTCLRFENTLVFTVGRLKPEDSLGHNS